MHFTKIIKMNLKGNLKNFKKLFLVVLIFLFLFSNVLADTSLRITFNESYIEKTKEERLFRPKEITPFDNIVCELKLSCVVDQPIRAKLVTVDENGEETLIKEGVLKKGMKSKDGEDFYYRLYINGWPYEEDYSECNGGKY